MAEELENEQPPPQQQQLTSYSENDHTYAENDQHQTENDQGTAGECYPGRPNPLPEGFMQKFRLYETRSVYHSFSSLYLIFFLLSPVF